MRKAVALKYFGSQRAIAKALDISGAAVSQWGEIIPEGSAYKLESVTRRRLRVDPACYRPPRRYEMRV